jgi:hypothetical protein
MSGYWRYATKIGVFSIMQNRDGRWHATFEDGSLGSYHSPQAALEDLVGGHVDFPDSSVDTSALGLPDELSEWEAVRAK